MTELLLDSSCPKIKACQLKSCDTQTERMTTGGLLPIIQNCTLSVSVLIIVHSGGMIECAGFAD